MGIFDFVGDIVDVFSDGWDEFSDILDPVEKVGTLAGRLFSGSSGGSSGRRSSGRSISLNEGLVGTRRAKGDATEDTALKSVDPRIVEAYWVKRLDNIAKITSRTSGK